MIPTPQTLDESTLSAVRAALGSYVREGDRATSLRDTLRRLSEEARTKGILAEHLLIVLKDLLSSLPEMHAIPEPLAREKLKQKIVTACIEQYYRK